jgi:hypothetical protein
MHNNIYVYIVTIRTYLANQRPMICSDFPSEYKLDVSTIFQPSSVYLSNIICESSSFVCCGNTRRPLVSKILVCPNVLFLNSENRRSSDNYDILLTMYDTTFKFYQYHIDSQNNIRLCKHDFMVIDVVIFKKMIYFCSSIHSKYDVINDFIQCSWCSILYYFPNPIDWFTDVPL